MLGNDITALGNDVTALTALHGKMFRCMGFLLIFTEKNLTDAQTNFGLWGDGRGEDELSPEEIQMVNCVLHLLIVDFFT